MKILKFILLFSLFAFKAQAKNPPLIVVSINPLYQILLAITQDEKNSILIINQGSFEHNYQMKKNDIISFGKADLIFYIDKSLEKNFPQLIKNFNAEKKSYELSKLHGIKILERRDNSKKTDVHLWLNPQNAQKIAEFMTQKICAIDQENCAKYQGNLDKFKINLVKNEKIIRAKLTKLSGTNFIFYHDGYQYFEEYFALNPVKIISYQHDRELSVKDMREFSNLAKSNQINCLFGEALDEKNSAQKLAKNYKIKFAVLNALGGKRNSTSEDGYNLLMLQLAEDMALCQNL